MLVLICIPYESFAEKVKIVKEFDGKGHIEVDTEGKYISIVKGEDENND